MILAIEVRAMWHYAMAWQSDCRLISMSSPERDELKRLVDELPDEKVPQVLADLRRHLHPVRERTWPPAFFGSIEGDGTAIGAHAEELLREGFGR